MDLTIPGRHYTYRLVRNPRQVSSDMRQMIEDLVSLNIKAVGLKVSAEALRHYTAYPIVTLAFSKGCLVGFHGMSIRHDGRRFVANLGSLYLRPGEAKGLGRTLMILSALPDLLKHPRWPLVFYTLTRSPRVVASGCRWLSCFYPDVKGGKSPPESILSPVEVDLKTREEFLEDRTLLTLAPPAWGYECVPLPKNAWSKSPAVNSYMKEALGPQQDRRVLVLGEVTIGELLKILTRSVTGR